MKNEKSLQEKELNVEKPEEKPIKSFEDANVNIESSMNTQTFSESPSFDSTPLVIENENDSIEDMAGDSETFSSNDTADIWNYITGNK